MSMYAESSGKLFKNRWGCYPFPLSVFILIVALVALIFGNSQLNSLAVSSLFVVLVLLSVAGLMVIYIPKKRCYAVFTVQKFQGVPILKIDLAQKTLLISPLKSILSIIDMGPRLLIKNFKISMPYGTIHVKTTISYRVKKSEIKGFFESQIKCFHDIDKDLVFEAQDCLVERRKEMVQLFMQNPLENDLNQKWADLESDLKHCLESLAFGRYIDIESVSFHQPYIILNIGRP